MSPTALFASGADVLGHDAGSRGRGEVYPGYGTGGWVGRAIPVPHQTSSQGPIFSIFKVKSPTHGQMKAIPSYSMRFPRLGPRMRLELTQN